MRGKAEKCRSIEGLAGDTGKIFNNLLTGVDGMTMPVSMLVMVSSE